GRRGSREALLDVPELDSPRIESEEPVLGMGRRLEEVLQRVALRLGLVQLPQAVPFGVVVNPRRAAFDVDLLVLLVPVRKGHERVLLEMPGLERVTTG